MASSKHSLRTGHSAQISRASRIVGDPGWLCSALSERNSLVVELVPACGFLAPSGVNLDEDVALSGSRSGSPTGRENPRHVQENNGVTRWPGLGPERD
jgi:hypothetical protein